MSQRLLFTGDRLLDGDHELARVDAHAHVVSGEREYAIIRRNRRGWDYEVVDQQSGRTTCEFRPFRVRRGGRLLCGGTTVLLRGKPLRPRLWTFTTESGACVRATSGGIPWADYSTPFPVILETEDSIGAIPGAVITLLFGCWLIEQWLIAGSSPVSGGAGP
jgi:hypothetical protein